MSNPDNPTVVATRWWWVRHAPVRNDGGNIYGQKDIACDTSDREVFEAVGEDPAAQRGLVFEQSHAHASDRGGDLGRRIPEARGDDLGNSFRRTESRRLAGHEPRRIPRQPTGSAAAGLPISTCPRPAARASWIFAIESFGAIERITAEQAGQDIIAVAHGGTIKAAVGLALGSQPAKGLTFDIDNCSVTRLDHFASAGQSNWRLPMVNQQPWIADARHAAMHQPAGPEIATASKLA